MSAALKKVTFLLIFLFQIFLFTSGVQAQTSGINHLSTYNSSSSASSSVSVSVPAQTNSNLLFVASISPKPGSEATSVSGLGKTWNRVKYQCAGRNNTGADLWIATGGLANSGTVQASFAAAPNNTVISVSVFSGVNQSNPVGNSLGYNTVGLNDVGCSAGVDAASYSTNINLANSGAIFSAVALRDKTHTPGAGYSELSDFAVGTGGAVAGISTMFKQNAIPGNHIINGTLSGSTDYAVAAFAINPAQTTQTSPPTPTSSSGLPGDANNDNRVDGLDYLVWLNHYGDNVSGASNGDFDNNNTVDGLDYLVWLNNYGRSINPTATPTTAPTAPPSPTSTPTMGPTTPPTTSSYIWISPQEIMALPTSGPAWQNVFNQASDPITPEVATDNTSNKNTLAAALVSVRTNNNTMRNRVIQALDDVQGTEETGNTGQSRILRICRNLQTYVIAADIIDYRDTNFMNWVRHVRDKIWPDYVHNVILHHTNRPNNHGTHCGASRLAADLYLNDTADFNNAVNVWKGYLGDRSAHAYTISQFGDLAWQDNASLPVGINRPNTTKFIDGGTRNIDGVIADDQRRQLEHGYPVISWPPNKEDYVYEALQGIIVGAEIMWRAGYNSGTNNVYSWSNSAILRAYNWLHTPHFEGNTPFLAAEAGDDEWQMWIVNKRYGAGRFPAPLINDNGGKNMSFTDWTHAP